MKKILVVEDSHTMRLFIKMYLRNLSKINIIEAENGIDAIEKLKESNFDLIITDTDMPRMDGLQFIDTVRTMMRLDTPIIFMPANVDEIEEGLLLGADNYVTKPVIGPVLTNRVKDHLRMAA